MMTEINREIIWFVGILTLINLALNVYNGINTSKLAKVLEGNTSHSTIAAIANVDNRRVSSISTGTSMD